MLLRHSHFPAIENDDAGRWEGGEALTAEGIDVMGGTQFSATNVWYRRRDVLSQI